MLDYATAWMNANVSHKDEGQGMVEYGLIIALVAVVAIAGLIVLGPKISAMFTAIGSSV